MKIKVESSTKDRGYCSEVGTFDIKSQVNGFNDVEKVLKLIQYIIENSNVTKIELEILR
jgi:hypothetical protein